MVVQEKLCRYWLSTHTISCTFIARPHDWIRRFHNGCTGIFFHGSEVPLAIQLPHNEDDERLYAAWLWALASFY